MKRITTTLAALTLAAPALAHPGHDAALTGAAHYAFSPLHGLGIIALALGLGLLRWLRRGGRDEQ
ncbi:hypothetical protein [Vannielia litorea]|uniref:hypothetical protein n=1 Tax=Vannielia litorea TaxID=1217970 RepID=UPI001BCF6A97|nr:hypothetical protein [Vannielia litorea]MBS8227965.1 hypothetical protein [Vannielia litorea]